MAEPATKILRHHKLSHLSELRIGENIFDNRFAGTCSLSNCNATCCESGVWVDVAERDNILAHALLVQRHMEPQQDKDPARWFEPDEYPDTDLPSGRAIGTQEREYGCVFLNSQGLCVLQKAAIEEGMDRYALKPFFCVAFPVAIDNSVLLIDDSDKPECCAATPNGSKTVFDVYSEELEFVLGPDGLKELRKLADTTDD